MNQWSVEQIEEAALIELKFPAGLVTNVSEATRVIQFLKSKKQTTKGDS